MSKQPTDRQYEITDYAQEYNIESAANKYGVSISTVKRYQRNVNAYDAVDETEESHFDKETGEAEFKDVGVEEILDPEDYYEKLNLDPQEYSISGFWYKTKKFGKKADISIHFTRRGIAEPNEQYVDKWVDQVAQRITKPTVPKKQAPNDKPLVVVIADTHIGLLTEDLKLIPDYNADVCRQSLQQIAAEVNQHERPVTIFHLGDVIESFTGLNHKDTWKYIQMYGAEVVLEAYDILDEFFDSLEYFEECYMVGGNHDRASKANDEDTEGQVAQLISGIFNRVGEYTVHFDKLMQTPVIDDIQYILTHADKRISRQDTTKLIWEFGNQNIFNMVLSAHFHHRKFHDEGGNWRNLSVPPVVTGSDFEERNGYTSTPGWLKIENYNGKPKITDIPL